MLKSGVKVPRIEAQSGVRDGVVGALRFAQTANRNRSTINEAGKKLSQYHCNQVLHEGYRQVGYGCSVARRVPLCLAI